MKQRIKKNNRRKADFGLGALIAGLIGAATSIGVSAMNAENQKAISDRQQRQKFLADNELNAQTALANQTEALNYNQNNEIETARTGYLSTINNQFRCGGKRRMKKVGGSISANVKGLGRYI